MPLDNLLWQMTNPGTSLDKDDVQTVMGVRDSIDIEVLPLIHDVYLSGLLETERVLGDCGIARNPTLCSTGVE